jgi:hypothetical protein
MIVYCFTILFFPLKSIVKALPFLHRFSSNDVLSMLPSSKPLSVSFFQSHPVSLKSTVCYDEKIINFIQKDQWFKAVNLVFNGDHSMKEKAFLHLNDKEMDFYHQQYGGILVDIETSTSTNELNSTASLLYHRISNSGDSIIQSLLYDYAFSGTQSVAEKRKNDGSIDEVNRCSSSRLNCAHKNVHLLFSSTSLDNYLSIHPPYSSLRYSFTFVREPIQRFISSFSQIDNYFYQKSKELGKQKSKSNQHQISSFSSIPLVSSRKSCCRIIEFIDSLLLKGPSALIFREFPTSEFYSIAPYIGTISSNPSMMIYHYEELPKDWLSLAKRSEILELHYVKDKLLMQIEDSSFQNKSSILAANFLSVADSDAHER